MLEERGGWFVVNVKDARWVENGAFGLSCDFERPDAPFPQVGVNLFLLEPGKPNCRYHREEAQEDLLVLSGRCRLLVNDEERILEAWDFVHFPPGVSHVLVGTDEPCAVLFVGHREQPPSKVERFYPESALARRYGAESPEPTADSREAYRDVPGAEDVPAPSWPPR